MKEYKLKINDTPYTVVIKDVTDDAVLAEVNGVQHIVHIDDVSNRAVPVESGSGGHPPAAPSSHSPVVPQASSQAVTGPGTIVTPIPGQVLSINVTAGEKVRSGQKLLVIEAMKMENSITADRDGTVSEILVAAGDVVGQGQVLIVLT